MTPENREIPSTSTPSAIDPALASALETLGFDRMPSLEEASAVVDAARAEPLQRQAELQSAYDVVSRELWREFHASVQASVPPSQSSGRERPPAVATVAVATIDEKTDETEDDDLDAAADGEDEENPFGKDEIYWCRTGNDVPRARPLEEMLETRGLLFTKDGTQVVGLGAGHFEVIRADDATEDELAAQDARTRLEGIASLRELLDESDDDWDLRSAGWSGQEVLAFLWDSDRADGATDELDLDGNRFSTYWEFGSSAYLPEDPHDLDHCALAHGHWELDGGGGSPANADDGSDHLLLLGRNYWAMHQAGGETTADGLDAEDDESAIRQFAERGDAEERVGGGLTGREPSPGQRC